MTTRVALIVAGAQLQARLHTVIASSPDIELTAAVASVDQIDEALARGVDVVVLEAALAGADVAEVVRRVTASYPLTGVVVAVEEPGPAVYTTVYPAAVEAGARAVMTASSSVEDVRGHLDQVAAWGRALRAHVHQSGPATGQRGQVLVVVGAKGGVGATVVACLLARAAVLPGRRVCLVDLDLRAGDVGHYAGVAARRSMADLAPVAPFLDGRTVREVAVDHPDGVSVIVAPTEVERAEEVTGEVVRLVLTHLRTQFDLIVVDGGSRLDDPSAMALELADDVLLVASADVAALRAARRALATWDRLSVRGAGGVRLVLSRVSRRVEVQPELAQRVVGIPTAAHLPAAFRELEGPTNTGQLMTAGSTSVARAVARLLESLDCGGVASGSGPTHSRAVSRAAHRAASGAVDHGGAGGARVIADVLVSRPAGTRVDAAPDAGQVAVETPVIVGFLLALTMLCLQMITWGVSHLLAQHAALEGARAAAVGATGAQVSRAADDALPLGWAGTARVVTRPTDVQVVVSTPLIVPWLGDLDVSSSAPVLREPR
ncbi:MAG: AAA family ATPase [Angustibacter sp.]